MGSVSFGKVWLGFGFINIPTQLMKIVNYVFSGMLITILDSAF